MGRKSLGKIKMSNAERQKKYRDRLNDDERKLKDKLRKRAARQKVYNDPNQHRVSKKKEATARRERRRQNCVNDKEVDKVAFCFPVLARSLHKVKRSLPRNEAQKAIVVTQLFEEQFQCSPRKKRLISSWTRITKKKIGRPCILNQELKVKIDNFLCDSSISVTLPGRNNQIYLGKDLDGRSLFTAKKFILWTLNELFSIMKEDNDEELSRIKFSTLYRYIKSKKEYIINSKILEVDCLCPLCESVELMLAGVGKVCDNINLPKKCHDLIEKICCKEMTFLCGNGTCPDCPGDIDLEMLIDVDKIPYYHWVKNQYYEKVLAELSGADMKVKLEEVIGEIKMHYFRKRAQSKMYKKQIVELMDKEMLIHVDYSENYKNKQQNEIKAAFYGQGQFSLYTACIYIRLEGEVVCKTFALVTPENDHSCNVSYALNKFLISEASNMHSCKKVKFWSDGCASQFRSKFAFYMMSKIDTTLELEWHYFEANHGKGAVDGIGGTVKNAVFRRVLSKHVVIEGPKHFAEYANSILPKINVIFVDENQMQLGFEDECRGNALYIPGTLRVHSVKRFIDGERCYLDFYEYTECKSDKIYNIDYEIGSLPKAPISLEERKKKYEERKNLNIEHKKQLILAKAKRQEIFEACREECSCEMEECAASGFQMCESCKSIQKSQCRKKKCLVGGTPTMILPKCDTILKVSDVFTSDEDDEDDDESSSEDEDSVERSTSCEDAREKSLAGIERFKKGDCVRIVRGLFIGYYAIVTDYSYGDEIEILYFQKTLENGKYVPKPNDLDSRDENDLQKVEFNIDTRCRYSFN